MTFRNLPLFTTVFFYLLSTEVDGQANTALSNLANPTAVNRSLIPSVSKTHLLGNGPANPKVDSCAVIISALISYSG